jgi:hypothetical protein
MSVQLAKSQKLQATDIHMDLVVIHINCIIKKPASDEAGFFISFKL